MKRFLTVVSLACFGLAGIAAADPITTYYDQGTWGGAVTVSGTETFTGGALSVATLVSNTDADGTLTNALYPNTWFGNVQYSAGDETTFGYSGGSFTAFGGTFDLSPSNYGSGLIITVNFTAGGSEQVAVLSDKYNSTGFTTGFFGVTSTQAISSFTIASQNPGTIYPYSNYTEAYTVDNVSFAGAAPAPVGVPEPATLSMLGLGLVGIGFARRFRRQ